MANFNTIRYEITKYIDANLPSPTELITFVRDSYSPQWEQYICDLVNEKHNYTDQDHYMNVIENLWSK